MRKLIHARFAGKCKVCSQGIAAGERAYWLGKGAGMQHVTCSDSQPDSPSGSVSDGTNLFVIPFHELREKYREMIGPDGLRMFRKNPGLAQSILSMWRTSEDWIGCTISEMKTWLDNGYFVPGLEGIDTSLIPSKPRRKIRYAEEGDELLIDLAWSGIDEHFMEWEKRNTKPGMKVEIDLCFNAFFPAHIIVSYEKWCARMLQTLEEQGLDFEVDLTNSASGVFTDAGNKDLKMTVRVKQSGEASDYAAWSAMFSPGGFRQITFAGILLAGEKFGRSVSEGLGSAITASDWIVEYDSESNTLRVANPGNASEFPEFIMTEKLRGVIEKLNG